MMKSHHGTSCFMTVEELLTKTLLLSEEHLQSGINEKTSYQDFKAELLRRFEALECCGNCKGWLEHEPVCLEAYDANGFCSQWQSDGLTRDEREGGDRCKR